MKTKNKEEYNRKMKRHLKSPGIKWLDYRKPEVVNKLGTTTSKLDSYNHHKTAMVKVNGKNELAMVIKENSKTVLLKFNHVGGTPVIKKKKNQVRLILGNAWDS